MGLLHGKLEQMVKLNIFIFSFFLNSIVVSNEIITIEIDGSNLPETQGEILRGEKIFKKLTENGYIHDVEILLLLQKSKIK